MNFAIVENGKVVNRVVSNLPLADNWIASETAQIGDDYDAATGEFSRPQVDPLPVNSSITRLQFRNRFTAEEKVAIYTAAETAVQIRIFLDDVNAAEDIQLSDPATIAGVQALELYGLIGAGRAAQILADGVA